MSNLGMGVMLNMMGDNEKSAKVFSESIGKTISKVYLSDMDELKFVFEDGSAMTIADEGQSCCEHRYMRTDDDLSEYVGAKLIGGEIKQAPSIQEEYEEHEVQFLEIQTSKGVFTMASHNEHNGYYGGFWVVAMEG